MHTETRFPCTHNRVFDTGSATAERSTWIVTWITAATMVIEIVAGWWFNSMALLADGWHMSSHTLALGLAAVAYAAARRYAGDSRFAFGTWKIEVLSGFASAIFLLGIAAMMVAGSVERIISPQPIHYREAILVAVLGLLVNLVCALILDRARHHAEHEHAHEHHHGHHHAHEHGKHQDLNIKSAYIHVLTDALTSVLAIVALSGGWLYGWSWLDPVAGIVGAILVAIWAKGLLIETGKVLLDREMDHPIVHDIMDSIETGDTHINDLHVWRVGKNAYFCAIAAITHDATVTPAVIRARLTPHKEIVHSTIELCLCPQGRSNSATDSTCEVCGNMLAIPAPRKT